MPRKPREWPERNELVVGTVTRVNPFSAFIALEEYGNKEGMVHISEVAGKWVRDIREFVKVGKKVVARVLRVDERKGYINLSLKRVRKYDAEEKMREFKREQKAERMLESVAKKLNISLDEAYEKIGFKLQEIFGEMFKAFQSSLTEHGYKLLIKEGLPKKYVDLIKSVAEEQLQLKEIEVKGEVEIKCYKPDGAKIIKDILLNAKKNYGIEIKYISAPKYRISLTTRDAKTGEKKLKEVGEKIVENIKNFGGEGLFKMVK
jgi:translation initiation factor 2 subunit 1